MKAYNAKRQLYKRPPPVPKWKSQLTEKSFQVTDKGQTEQEVTAEMGVIEGRGQRFRSEGGGSSVECHANLSQVTSIQILPGQEVGI